MNFIWFTDEELCSIASPTNTQNNRLYAPFGTPKKDVPSCRLLRTRATFSKSLMVSVGMSALGCTVPVRTLLIQIQRSMASITTINY